ncbi:MAG: efflux transporter periplasmic adaptor subunit [Flavobacteriaceae bacterium]|nr:MAG: efflux transporter periplasmic adaptor subunit [Flavobacteriaceae bacterium]
MKKIAVLLSLSILIVSCGNSKKPQLSIEDLIATNNLEQIQTTRKELVTHQHEIVGKIKQLDVKINELDTSKRMALITTFEAKTEEFIHYLELQGSVNTKRNLIIYPEFSGILTKVLVKEGQFVRKGQLLAIIDDGGLSQQITQMQINTRLAKTVFDRQARLWSQKIGSEIEYLQAKATYEGQQQSVAQLEKQLDRTRVTAPFSGTIDDIITEQGSVVAPGQSELMRIINLSNMYIETDVPEKYIAAITKNKQVLVSFPVLGTSLTSKIRQAGNYINPANRTFKIEVAIPNKDRAIKPNLTAKLKINDYSNPAAILIPQSIVSENAAGQQYVYVITDKRDGNIAKTKKQIIETGKTQGDIIEVLSGLSTGDEVIKEGARSVKEGQEVKIINL